MKVRNGNYSACYIKMIKKLQYKFADAKRNGLTGQHNLSAFIGYCTFNILYFLLSVINPRGSNLQHLLEKVTSKNLF